MSTTTSNLELIKYESTDNVSPLGYNLNFDKIDSEIANLKSDYIVNTGTNDNWTWRKWNSGRCEVFGTSGHMDISGWNSYGALYWIDLTSPVLPFKVRNPNCYVTIERSSQGLYFTAPWSISSNNCLNFHLISADPNDTFSGYTRYFISGWWN